MNMIDLIILKLIQLYEAYLELYELSSEKRTQIISGDATLVQETVKKEWTLLSKLTEYEEEREQLVDQLCKKEDASDLTLDDVLDLSTEDQKKKLEMAAFNLREILKKQQEINAENQSLIELHLEYADYMINIVLKEPQLSNVYGNSGVVAELDPENKGIIDNEA